MWKAGCLIFVLGLGVLASSFVLFGSAVKQAVDARQVDLLELEPGAEPVSQAAEADSSAGARLRVQATIEVSPAKLREPRERAEIFQISAPVAYSVRDEAGASVHRQAATLNCSTILPEQSSPHFDSFERRVSCSHQSDKFEVPPSGRFFVAVDLPANDDLGNPLVAGRVEVFDRVAMDTADRTLGGVITFVTGPVLLILGLALFIVGLLIQSSKKSRENRTQPGTYSGAPPRS